MVRRCVDQASNQGAARLHETSGHGGHLHDGDQPQVARERRDAGPERLDASLERIFDPGPVQESKVSVLDQRQDLPPPPIVEEQARPTDFHDGPEGVTLPGEVLMEPGQKGRKLIPRGGAVPPWEVGENPLECLSIHASKRPRPGPARRHLICQGFSRRMEQVWEVSHGSGSRGDERRAPFPDLVEKKLDEAAPCTPSRQDDACGP
jgi:hypothetical protein